MWASVVARVASQGLGKTISAHSAACRGNQKKWMSVLSGTQGPTALEKKIRFGRILHVEEKEIKKSGLPIASGAGLATAASQPVERADVPEFQYEIVEHVPWLSLTNTSRRHDAILFLSEVFRTIGQHNISLDLVSTTVSNVAIALPEGLPASRLESLESDLNELKVNCRYDNDGSMIHFHSCMFTKQRVEYEVFKLFSDNSFHSHMLVSKSQNSGVSVVLPKGELELALNKLNGLNKFSRF